MKTNYGYLIYKIWYHNLIYIGYFTITNKSKFKLLQSSQLEKSYRVSKTLYRSWTIEPGCLLHEAIQDTIKNCETLEYYKNFYKQKAIQNFGEKLYNKTHYDTMEHFCLFLFDKIQKIDLVSSIDECLKIVNDNILYYNSDIYGLNTYKLDLRQDCINGSYCVYRHVSPIGKSYIGITKYGEDPDKRWKKGWGYFGQAKFYAAIQQFGWDNFQHEILVNNLSLF